MPDYLNNLDENGNVKQFHAYYMTYSGHHPYYDVTETDKTRNPMVFQNREIVDPLNVSSHVKGYFAANLELENMVKELLKGLEAAGCLENTVIVLTNDHYPYGLTDKEFKEMVKFNGYSLESTYGLYENSFICYNAGMKEKVVVDAPCCSVDIIPTLLNLFGVEYDSRLLAGTDILDPYSFHVAMLYNQSFITDKIKYNTSNGKITYLVDKSEVSQEYVDACIKYVKNKFEISLQIISNDYYKIIYDSLGQTKTQ
jgi:phosphoglycerol transferase MdoB-like AlkP superfamily enzyme